MSYLINPREEKELCKICGGRGIIYIWRSDLEDFDESLCPECINKEEE
ncbi:MAG: hypothetical protein ACFFFB_18855 [Candidatus Heimdallarchaeota archaeon]